MGAISVDEDKLRELLASVHADEQLATSVDDMLKSIKLNGIDDPESHLFWYKAHCVSVHDGHTVHVDWDLGGGLLMQDEPLRLVGINAPEMSGASKNRGAVVRDYLRELILEEEVAINTVKDKKSKGRYLARIFFRQDGKWLNVNQHLMEKFEDVVPFM